MTIRDRLVNYNKVITHRREMSNKLQLFMLGSRRQGFGRIDSRFDFITGLEKFLRNLLVSYLPGSKLTIMGDEGRSFYDYPRLASPSQSTGDTFNKFNIHDSTALISPSSTHSHSPPIQIGKLDTPNIYGNVSTSEMSFFKLPGHWKGQNQSQLQQSASDKNVTPMMADSHRSLSGPPSSLGASASDTVLENTNPSLLQSSALPSYIDIDQITDRVYYAIERKIKMQKEQRGFR